MEINLGFEPVEGLLLLMFWFEPEVEMLDSFGLFDEFKHSFCWEFPVFSPLLLLMLDVTLDIFVESLDDGICLINALVNGGNAELLNNCVLVLVSLIELLILFEPLSSLIAIKWLSILEPICKSLFSNLFSVRLEPLIYASLTPLSTEIPSPSPVHALLSELSKGFIFWWLLKVAPPLLLLLFLSLIFTLLICSLINILFLFCESQITWFCELISNPNPRQNL
uniref:Uncharacterized protein n=1 Tax=Cryptosporidium parvum TaxID=5807 RepID=F0X4R9_CRYPV